jgi:uncharacterized protein
LRAQLFAMVKVPRMGRVKTRLARDIGPAAAVRFYRANLGHVTHRLARDPRFQTCLAIAPDTDRARVAFPPQVLRFGQGGGDLGQRMQRLFDRALPGPVIIIGTDIPAVTSEMIADAFKVLCTHDAVFGPATDGGYWLVGVRSARRTPHMFAHVRWSTEWALADTLRNLAGRRVGFVDVLSDVDSAADVRSQAWCLGRRIVPKTTTHGDI